MGTLELNPDLDRRIRELVSEYSSPSASLAWLLCDRHPADSIAYDVVDAHGSATRITYGDLKRRSETIAVGLASIGVSAGDRVATLAGKSEEYLICLLGIWRLGAVHVPLFTAFGPPAIAQRLSGSKTKVVVSDASQVEKLAAIDRDAAPLAVTDLIVIGESTNTPVAWRAHKFEDMLAAEQSEVPAAALGGDAPFIHIYTSGTTGKPKGVIVPTRAIAAFRAYVDFGIGLLPSDVYWCAADPGWAYGLYFGVIGSLSTGVHSLFLQGGFDAAATYRTLVERGVTNFAAAPTVYRSLMCSEVAPPSDLKLRCASSAGEPLTPDVNEWAKAALGTVVFDHYGQTEAGMLINNHHDPRLATAIRPGSMGIAMPGWKAVVLDRVSDVEVPPGEVGRVAFDIAESPFAWFHGYDGAPEKSAEKFSPDGKYYLSGDLGKLGDDGAFYFSSREDDVIIMAGYRIGPFEVESVIASHPAVAECAVIAAPDKIRGEVLEAFVVLRPSFAASPAMAEEIQQWVKTRYAAHAYPRQVHFSNELPKTPSGKIQRFLLREKRGEIAQPSPGKKGK